MDTETGQIIKDLLLEDELKKLPEPVHLVFRKKVYHDASCPFTVPTPEGRRKEVPFSEEDEEIIKENPRYAAWAERAIRRWCLSAPQRLQPSLAGSRSARI